MGSPFNTATPTATPNFDNLLLESLMSRLQLRHQPPLNHHNNHHPLLSQSLEDLLLDGSFPFSSDDDEDFSDTTNGGNCKTNLSKEESKLEKELVKIILSGNTEILKPNSGQAVNVGDHHVCVGFHDEKGSEYRVWEWHGHIMLFDDDNGYSPEYIYGNYFERRVNLVGKSGKNLEKNEVGGGDDGGEGDGDGEEEEMGKCENLGGLRDLIGSGDCNATRILHQSRHAGSPGVLKGTSGN